MALHKRVKEGGAFYKGYQLTVNSAAGDYVLNISTDVAFKVSSVDFVADGSGSGDYITITHHNDTAAGAIVTDTIGETLYNPGPFTPMKLNFPAIEPFKADEDLRVTYTNAASIALVLNVYVEFIR